MKKIMLILSLTIIFSLCSCGKSESVGEDSKDISSKTKITSNSSSTISTTDVITTKPVVIVDDFEDEPYIEPDDSVEFKTEEELIKYLDKNFSEYEYAIPEYDKEKYTVNGIILWEMSKCYYIDYLDKNDNIASISVNMSEQKVTYADLKKSLSQDLYGLGVNITEYKEKNIIVNKSIFVEEDEYVAYGITDDGLEYSLEFFCKENLKPDELVEKLEDFKIGA